jgi:ribosomal protein S18 acetylase RimI-like enzyme
VATDISPGEEEVSATTSNLTIRPFQAADQETARRLVLTGLGEHFGFIDETMNPDLDDIQAHYVDPGHCFVLAEIDGERVGTGALIEEDPQIGRLVRMSVDADYRGRGIGKQLVRYLTNVAKQRGYTRLVTETNDDWVDAIGLYRACGFETEGFRDGDIHLALDLATAS